MKPNPVVVVEKKVQGCQIDGCGVPYRDLLQASLPQCLEMSGALDVAHQVHLVPDLDKQEHSLFANWEHTVDSEH